MGVGGTLAHLLAIDHALRPVLASWAARTCSGPFLLDVGFRAPPPAASS
jgi:hypothetical protein